jgi:hypothetical protein
MLRYAFPTYRGKRRQVLAGDSTIPPPSMWEYRASIVKQVDVNKKVNEIK